jgi:hypothetical protein
LFRGSHDVHGTTYGLSSEKVARGLVAPAADSGEGLTNLTA